MSFFFLHPLYLFGMAAAALPILIHLLNRRRLQRIRFPAVRFIVLSKNGSPAVFDCDTGCSWRFELSR